MRRQRHRSWTPARQIVALAALALCSWEAQALTLGRFQVLSGSGEALRAEVEITDFRPQQHQGLSARIAPPASFRAAGMEFNPGLADVTARIEKRSNGQPFIVLTGQRPLSDLFIDVILEAQWDTGRLVKNYALLLNPGSPAPAARPAALPAAADPTGPSAAHRDTTTPAAVATPIPASPPAAPTVPPSQASRNADLQPRSTELNAQQVPVYRFEPPAAAATPSSALGTAASAPPSAAPAARMASPSNPTPRPDAPVLVEAGDTLSQIALRLLNDNVSLDQMMIALLRSNPQAFIEGNVNLVKAGAALKIPDPQQTAGISREEARRQVSEQTRAFIDYAAQLGQSPLRLQAKTSAQEVSGQVEDKTPPVTSPGTARDTLTLSQGTVAAASEAARTALQKELKDTSTQVAQITRNLQDLQALADGRAPESTMTKDQNAKAAQAPAQPVQEPASQAGAGKDFLTQLSQDRNTQIWTAALVLAVGLIAYWIARRRRQEDADDFAPSYEETAGEPMGSPMAMGSRGMPAMPDLDLNLDPAATTTSPIGAGLAAGSATGSLGETVQLGTPVQGSSASPMTSDQDSMDLSKLNLAAQLVAKGDHDLARALLGSVLSSASAELRQRAQQLLSQMP